MGLENKGSKLYNSFWLSRYLQVRYFSTLLFIIPVCVDCVWVVILPVVVNTGVVYLVVSEGLMVVGTSVS